MFIRYVDEGLERLVREQLPLPDDLGDVSFEMPTGTWSAQISRLTVNFFLFQVDRSNQPSRSPQTRTAADGRQERRVPLPMVELSYLVSAWAGGTRDEHQLLGQVASLLSGVTALPEQYAAPGLNSSVVLSLGGESGTGGVRPREVWQGVGGTLKAALMLRATVATDTWEWTDQAAGVQRIAVLADRMSDPTPL